MRRLITTPGIFALLTSDGDHIRVDHMSTGKAGDMVAVADMFDAMHREDRRLCTVPVLASRFRNGTTYPIPCVRLTKAECRVLVNTITDFGQSIPKTTKTRKPVDLLISSVCVYWSEPFTDDETAGRVTSASLDYFNRNTFFALLVPVVGWGLSWLLGLAPAHSIQSKAGATFYRRLCPIVGVLAAFLLTYKLVFSA